MVRARRILEVIEADGLFDHAAEQGRYLRARLDELADDFPAAVLDVARPRIDVCVQPADHRRARRVDPPAVANARMIVLPSGPIGVRFRPALTVSRADIDAAVTALRDALTERFVES